MHEFDPARTKIPTLPTMRFFEDFEVPVTTNTPDAKWNSDDTFRTPFPVFKPLTQKNYRTWQRMNPTREVANPIKEASGTPWTQEMMETLQGRGVREPQAKPESGAEIPAKTTRPIDIPHQFWGIETHGQKPNPARWDERDIPIESEIENDSFAWEGVQIPEVLFLHAPLACYAC